MIARLARQRGWLACLYGLAVVLAQGFHTHGVSSLPGGHAGDAASCGAEGDHAGADEARGDAPALSSCATDCPSCEYALGHQATLADRAEAADRARLTPRPPPLPAEPGTSPIRPKGRAPPLA